MAIKKININGTEHELQTTIANVDNLQSSLDAKQATVTGGASTITSSNLTANRALISNGSGKVTVSAVTSTELGYLDGVTSNIQTQLDGKSDTSLYVQNDEPTDAADGSVWIDLDEENIAAVKSVAGVLPDANGNVALTSESIGAIPDTTVIPAELGCGVYEGDIDSTGIDTPFCKNSVVWITQNTINNPTGDAGILETKTPGNVTFVQTATYHNGGNNLKLRRSYVNNSWGEWEWENPPMINGYEYKTTERFHNEPVYAKAVEFGYAPNTTEKLVEHGLSIRDVVDYGGCLYLNGYFQMSLPWGDAVKLKINNKHISITTTLDYSPYTIDVWLKYTK